MPRWSLATRPGVPGGVAIFELLAADADDLERAMTLAGLAAAPVGRCVLCDLLGVDRGIVARWDERSASLMPHGGPAVVAAIAGRLTELGFEPLPTGPGLSEADCVALFPEARSTVEARALEALGRAASPRAVDLLLAQHERWRLAERDPALRPDRACDAIRRRLLDPPTVAAVGLANIGKSSLLNALAGRGVAGVADRVGTTRDFVGASIELDGLAVRWIDTPGLCATDAPRAHEADHAAADLTRALLARADLIVLCFDASAGGVGGVERGEVGRAAPGVPTLEAALRADRAGEKSAAGSLSVSALRGEGLDRFARAVRSVLMPDEALDDPRAWRFWEESPVAESPGRVP